MNASLYEAAAAMDVSARWQELITQNLASSSVPGFKKEELSVVADSGDKSFAAELRGARDVVVPKLKYGTNFSPGSMRFTEVETDVAIEGPGFFQIELPSGERLFTRDGEFHINGQGAMVTKEGYPVVSDSGSLDLNHNNPAPLTIAGDGQVSQGKQALGKIKLTEFDQPRKLERVSGAYFRAKDKGAGEHDADTSRLRQGYLENSNVSTVSELANMIAAMRNFEANQRMVQVQDQRMGRMINDLGNPIG